MNNSLKTILQDKNIKIYIYETQSVLLSGINNYKITNVFNDFINKISQTSSPFPTSTPIIKNIFIILSDFLNYDQFINIINDNKIGRAHV